MVIATLVLPPVGGAYQEPPSSANNSMNWSAATDTSCTMMLRSG